MPKKTIKGKWLLELKFRKGWDGVMNMHVITRKGTLVEDKFIPSWGKFGDDLADLKTLSKADKSCLCLFFESFIKRYLEKKRTGSWEMM